MSKRRRWAGRTTAIAVVLGCLTSIHLPATARTRLPEGAAGHYAGSQIAKYEGAGTSSRSAPPPSADGGVEGIDVSSHQGEVDWQAHWNEGKRFAYVKATEGTGYLNPQFGGQYAGSYGVGMIRGAYHFALPDRSDGASQARYFVANGGGWSADGRTLPGVLDVEYNPYGETCYGMSHAALVDWISNFSGAYAELTGRRPVVYTSTQWWARCTGGAGDFSGTSPLWVARYSDAVGELPHAWTVHTIWQHTSTPLDQNVFNGSYERLVALSTGTPLQ